MAIPYIGRMCLTPGCDPQVFIMNRDGSESCPLCGSKIARFRRLVPETCEECAGHATLICHGSCCCGDTKLCRACFDRHAAASRAFGIANGTGDPFDATLRSFYGLPDIPRISIRRSEDGEFYRTPAGLCVIDHPSGPTEASIEDLFRVIRMLASIEPSRHGRLFPQGGRDP